MGASNNIGLIIDASSGTRDNVYFVGPFGPRVSFASQQRRALNLVWALQKADRWPKIPQPRAAVIGAGIAGMTIAVALRMQGAAVRIFESEGSILSLQREAGHRLVHPTINFWPEAELSWTTEFPFFDWYAAACPKIITSLNDEWKAKFKDEIAEPVPNARLVRIGKSKAHAVPLFFEGGRQEEADFVFITTGFGEERDLVDPVTGDRRKGLYSYWEQDFIDRWTDRQTKRWVVSGTGDGGVIDALRLTYQNFMSEELALQVLYACDSKPLQDAVKAIELEAQNESNDAKRAKFYAKKYEEIAVHLPDRAQRLLPHLGGASPVTMIGAHDHPFDLSSAPIHKIILALSLKKDRIRYKKGKLEIDSAGNWWLAKGSTREALIADKLVVRHGASAPLWSLLSKKEARELKSKQRLLGDYLNLDNYHDSDYFDHPEFVANRDTNRAGFARSRAELAREILRSRFKVGMRRMGDHFEIVVDNEDARETAKVMWPRPSKLFGIDVIAESGSESDMDELTDCPT